MAGLGKDAALTVSLATGALVYSVYSNATPTLADIRAGSDNDEQMYRTSRGAFLLSLGVASAVSLLAGDPTIFCIGGGTAVALEWMHRHANAVDPESGRAVIPLQYVADSAPVTDGQLAGAMVG